MNKELLPWAVFLYDLEKLFRKFKFPVEAFPAKIFKDDVPDSYLDIIHRAKQLLGRVAIETDTQPDDVRLVSIFSRVKSDKQTPNVN